MLRPATRIRLPQVLPRLQPVPKKALLPESEPGREGRIPEKEYGLEEDEPREEEGVIARGTGKIPGDSEGSIATRRNNFTS